MHSGPGSSKQKHAMLMFIYGTFPIVFTEILHQNLKEKKIGYGEE